MRLKNKKPTAKTRKLLQQPVDAARCLVRFQLVDFCDGEFCITPYFGANDFCFVSLPGHL